MTPPFPPPLLRRRTIAAAAVAATCLLTLMAACSVAHPPAATVDGMPITDEQLADNIRFFTFLSGLNGRPCGQPAGSETPDAACARATLSSLIQEDLVKAYAANHDLSVSDQIVHDTVSRLESQLGADQLSQSLEKQHMTRADLDAFAGRLLLFDQVQRAVAAERVSDAELQQQYEQNKAQFTDLHAAHILVDSRREANRIEKQLTPDNFADLAAKFSTDTGSAANGGDLGTIPASQLDATFVQAALALKPGEISTPVHTQFGWHIIRLVEASVKPFEQVRQQLLDQVAGQAFQSWLLDRLASANITVNPKYGRLDRAQGQVVPIRSTATESPSIPEGDGVTPGP